MEFSPCTVGSVLLGNISQESLFNLTFCLLWLRAFASYSFRCPFRYRDAVNGTGNSIKELDYPNLPRKTPKRPFEIFISPVDELYRNLRLQLGHSKKAKSFLFV